MTILDFVLLAAAGLVLARGMLLAWTLRRIPLLVETESGARDPLPSVTIACAARNEEPHVERAARSWLKQDVPKLEVVVVDDRSSDGTGRVLDRLAAEDPRLVALHVERRPDGWLGKCHALSLAAQRATGDYVLFTDADVRLAPDTLRRALAYCERNGVDVLSLLPDTETDHVVHHAFTLFFFQEFLLTLGGARVNRGDCACAVGIGAFNLVRRSAYERVGGHEPIRLQVGDDVALVRLLAREGFRHRVLGGRDLACLRWQAGVWGTIRGIEKNTFWAARFSLLLTAAFSGALLFGLMPLAGAFVGSWAGWAAFVVGVVGAAVPYVVSGPLRPSLAAALLHPVSVLLMIVATWNSAVRTLARGGIRWRDDFFSLAELRAAHLPFSWWFGKAKARDAANAPARDGKAPDQ